MKALKFVFLIIILSSCNQEHNLKQKAETRDSISHELYSHLNNEFHYTNLILKKQIKENLYTNKLIKNDTVRMYDSLTIDYLMFLKKTYGELVEKSNLDTKKDYSKTLAQTKHSNDFFFEGENYNDKGVEFMDKTSRYRSEIVKLIDNKNLSSRINGILNTGDITTRQKKRVKLLNLLCKDTPLIGVLTYIRFRERCVIEFENEFLYDFALKNKK